MLLFTRMHSKKSIKPCSFGTAWLLLHRLLKKDRNTAQKMVKITNKILLYLFDLFIIFLSFGVTHGHAAEPRVEVNWNLSPTDKVGSRKSGIACFPNGALRWKDIAKPDSSELATHLGALLLPNAQERQIKGKLVSIKASLCTPWLGVGEAEPKSTFKITMIWSFVEPSGILADEIVETEIGSKQLDLRVNATLFFEAFETSLKSALSRGR